MNPFASPPRLFATVSLIMIVAMLTAAGFTQASFFRQTVIDREAVIVRDMVDALAIEHRLSAADLKNYGDMEARTRIEQSFGALKSLSDVVRIKVFNRDFVIAWSDDLSLIGTRRTAHLDHLKSAMEGEVRAVFNPKVSEADILARGVPALATMEYYVPLFAKSGAESSEAIGVLSLYRSPEALNDTIKHGMYLLWAVIGGAGLLLFIALYRLFSAVYGKQQSAEMQFNKLTTEHERIVQIEKMSAMGQLVGEIAHQLNNPLVGVLNLAQLAERHVGDTARVKELLVQVQNAGTECRDIVQRILRINQIARSEPQPTDMIELVRDTIAFCRQTFGTAPAVVFEEPSQAAMLNVDPILVRHALFNLIHNAVLAAPEGTVRVSLAAVERDGVLGFELAVSDAGSGISEAVAANLFKPFFTTRQKGTGLGLAVAQHIAIKHGGKIGAANLPGGGARFTIWLPAVTTL